MRFPPCTCTSSPRPLPLCTPHTTLLFSAPTLLSCHAAPLIRFRFQPEGPGESPWRATWNDEERRTGDSGYPRANREKERGRERVISEGCEPRTRIYLYSFVAGITDHPPREITREEIFGIEWTIMRLHLNNLRGVDWVQVGEGGGGFWIRGCRSMALRLLLFRSVDETSRKELEGYTWTTRERFSGAIRLFAGNQRIESLAEPILGGTRRILGAVMSFSSGGRPVCC